MLGCQGCWATGMPEMGDNKRQCMQIRRDSLTQHGPEPKLTPPPVPFISNLGRYVHVLGTGNTVQRCYIVSGTGVGCWIVDHALGEIIGEF